MSIPYKISVISFPCSSCLFLTVEMSELFVIGTLSIFLFWHFTSLAKAIAFLQNAEGNGLAPFDCWLCLRGVKTMALRVEKQQVQNNLISCS